MEAVDLDVKEDSSTLTENDQNLSTGEKNVEVNPEDNKGADEIAAPQEMSEGEKRRAKYLSKDLLQKNALLEEKDKEIRELRDFKEQKSVSEIARPKEEDFETNDAYLDAMDSYQDKRADARSASRVKQEEKDNKQKAVAASWDGFFDRADKMPYDRRSDASEAMSDETIPYNATMVSVIQESSVGPDLAIYFHKNKKAASEISNMSPFKTFNKMKELSENIVKAGSSKSVSNAPRPITPLNEESGALTKGLEDAKTTDDVEAMMRKMNLVG